MTSNLFTAAAAAFLASSAMLASVGDAEARGFGGAGGFHRMSKAVGHSNIARGAAVHRGLAAKASHIGHMQRGLQANKGLRAAQTMRHRGNLAQLSKRNNPTLSRNALQNNNQTALNNRFAQNQAQGRRYADMGNMPPANNTPPRANGGPNQPQNNGNPGPIAKGSKGLPKDHLINKGHIPIWISKPVDVGVTYLVPVYGPAKSVVDTYRNVKPKIDQTLQNSALSNKLHDDAIKAAEEAAKARKDQGGGVFQPSGLNDPSLMDP